MLSGIVTVRWISRLHRYEPTDPAQQIKGLPAIMQRGLDNEILATRLPTLGMRTCWSLSSDGNRNLVGLQTPRQHPQHD